MIKRLRKILFVVAFSFIMLAIFGAAESTAGCNVYLGETEHNCRYGFHPSTPIYGKSAAGTVVSFSTEIEEWKNNQQTPTVRYYHLVDDYTLDRQIVIGENVLVGVCCYKYTFTYSQDQIEMPQNGGFFVYDCTMHGCFNVNEATVTISQQFIDFEITLNKLENGNTSQFVVPAGKYGLRSDFDFLSYIKPTVIEATEETEAVEVPAKIKFADPYNTAICFNNYNKGCNELKTYLISLGVTVFENCNEVLIETHKCYGGLLGEAEPIDQNLFDQIEEDVLEINELTGFAFGFLTGDVEWNGEISVKGEGAVVICKNGYEFDVKVSGNVIVHDCTPHICKNYGYEEFMPLYNNTLSMFSMLSGGNLTLMSGNYAFMENVDLSSYNIVVTDESEIVICTNGFDADYGDNNILLNKDNVDFIDCTLSKPEVDETHTCDKISPHITAIYVDENNIGKISDLNYIAQMTQSGEFAIALSEEIKCYYPIVIPKGLKITACLNGNDFIGEYNSSKQYGTLFDIEYGASLTFCNCKAEGSISTITENNLNNSSAESSSAQEESYPMFSSVFENRGTLILDSVNVYGAVGVINNGRLIVRNSGIHGFVGVMQNKADEDENPMSGFTYVNAKGSEITGAFYGFISTNGNVSLEDVTITSCANGLIIGDENTLREYFSGISINSGEIGSIELDNVTVNLSYNSFGVAKYLKYEGDLTEIEGGDIIKFDRVTGVAIGSEINVTGDLKIDIDSALAAPYEKDGTLVYPEVADMAIAEGFQLNVADGVEISDDFTIKLLSGVDAVVANRELENVTMEEGYVSYVDNAGKMHIVNEENATFLNSASLENFYFTFDGLLTAKLTCWYNDEFLNNDKSQLKLTVGNGEFSLSPKDAGEVVGENSYEYTIYVAPSELKNTLKIQFYNGNIKWTVAKNLSLESYLYSIIEEMNAYVERFTTLTDKELAQKTEAEKENYNSELKALQMSKDVHDLVIALINYCQTSAVYFGNIDSYEQVVENFYNQEDDIENISAAMNGIQTEDLENYKLVVNENEMPQGVKIAGTSVVLDYGVTMRYFFIITDEVKDKITITCGEGESLELNPYEGVTNGYYVDIEPIRAQNIKKVYKMEISDGTDKYSFEYGVLGYMYNVLNNPEASDELKDLAKATWIYANLAENVMTKLGEA